MASREAGSGGPRQRSRRRPGLVVMVGPPGTGKSYLARLVSARVPLEIVESDEIRRRLSPKPTYSAQENQRVFGHAYRRIAGLLRRGTNVLFDATNIKEWSRRRAYRLAESVGARLLIVRTTAPTAVIAERLRRRAAGETPEDRSEAGWDVFLRMAAELEEIQMPHKVVDTSGDLEEAVAEIAEFMSGG